MNKIIAKEYKILKKVDGENIIYAKIVYLGNGDSPDNWIEVPEKEYLDFLKTQEQEIFEDKNR